MMLPDLALLVLRLVVGGIFVAHGYPKLFGGPGKEVPPSAAQYLGQGFVQAMEHGSLSNFATVMAQMGVPAPTAMAWFVACLEFFGGIMLVIGWLTRPVAFLLAGEMAVAVRRVHFQNGLVGPGGFEFPLALFGACIALAGLGPGHSAVEPSAVGE
ncbi:MAG: DoxX family protein [Candidatus Limnocylindrales bacterium]